jgi:glutamate racemase
VCSRSGVIAVLATPATIASHVYRDRLRTLRPDAKIIEVACPLFVPLVENGRFRADDTVVQLVTEEYLAPVRECGADTVILGCTHYPLLADTISRCVPGAELINSGNAAAAAVAEYIRANAPADTGRQGTRRYFVSDDAAQFERNAAMYLGHELEMSAERVDIEGY